jgi:hypothetical protein
MRSKSQLSGYMQTLVFFLVAAISCISNQSEAPLASAADNSPAPSLSTTHVPIQHVFVIVLENESFESAFGDQNGNGGDSCLKAIASDGVLLTQYYGIGHNSMDNYIAMVSGQSPNPATQQACPVFAEFLEEPTAVLKLKEQIESVAEVVNAQVKNHRHGDWNKSVERLESAY